MNPFLFRIHTADDDNLPTIAGQFFPGFTILTGIGYIDSFKHTTATIEVYGTDEDRPNVLALAKAIATVNEQDEVVVVTLGKDGIEVTPVEAAVEPVADNVIPFTRRAA